jgi:hypothetical protein
MEPVIKKKLDPHLDLEFMRKIQIALQDQEERKKKAEFAKINPELALKQHDNDLAQCIDLIRTVC